MSTRITASSHGVAARLGVLILLSVLVCLPAAPARAGLYQFAKIADNTSGQFLSLAPWPAVNGSGHVLFDAALYPSGQGGGLFVSDGATITPIPPKPGTYPSFGTDQVINNSDEVAFLDVMHASVFKSSGGVTTTIADNTGFYSIGDWGPSMNNNGTVLFTGQSRTTGLYGIYSGNGGAVTTVIDTSGDFSYFGHTPSINDSETVAFSAYSKTSKQLGVYTIANGVVTKITDTSGPIADVLNQGPVTINNAGTVAFLAQLDSGGLAIYRGDAAESLEMVADTSGPFDSFMDEPIVNNQGQIAFLAYLDGGGEGIYTGPDPVADKIVATGDVIDGQTLTNIDFFGSGFADNGWVTFVGTTQSGEQILYVGHPAPEPSALVLLAVGILGFIAHAWRRRAGN